MGPLEQEIAELLGEAMGKSALGLEIRMFGTGDESAESLQALSSEQRLQIFLESFTGIATAFGRLAREIERLDSLVPNEEKG